MCIRDRPYARADRQVILRQYDLPEAQVLALWIIQLCNSLKDNISGVVPFSALPRGAETVDGGGDGVDGGAEVG